MKKITKEWQMGNQHRIDLWVGPKMKDEFRKICEHRGQSMCSVLREHVNRIIAKGE